MTRTLALLLALVPLSAHAQSVGECDWRASVAAIAEPWEENTRTFANGAVRLTLLDTVEPALGSYHLLLQSPPYDEMGNRSCATISWDGTVGFTSIQFDALQAAYDPAVGLIWTLPVRFYDAALDFSNVALLTVTLNQATGAVGTSMELGRE